MRLLGGIFCALVPLTMLPSCAVADTSLDDGVTILADGGRSDGGGNKDGSNLDTGSLGKDSGNGSDTGGGGSDTGLVDDTFAEDTSVGADTATTCIATDSSECPSATPIGKVSGDTGADVKTATGSNSQWLQVVVSEDDSSLLSSKDLKATVTLDSPPGENFDLYVYVGKDGGALECSVVAKSSTSTTGPESVSVGWSDMHPIGGHDDTRTLSIEVRAAGEPCDPSATWTLTVTGDK